MRHRHRFLIALVALFVAVGGGVAQASDASLTKAMKAYKTRLTTDIAYLANFSAPAKARAGATLTKLGKINRDLLGARHAAQINQASTASGRKGRTEVLSALGYALTSTKDATASARAARAGHRAAARADARAALREINKAIPLFEDGGRRLHLF